MTTDPGKPTIRAWTRLVRAHHRALSGIETALKQNGFPPLSWYDALLELDRVGDDGLRPFELEQKLLLPQYGLSRLVARIESAGYLTRRPAADDGRGQVIAITKSGRDLRARMWPVYSTALQTAIGHPLTDREAITLASLLDRIGETETKPRP